MREITVAFPETREEARTQALERRRARCAAINRIKLRAGCADCGYNAHPAALEFDHRPGEKKLFEISSNPCGKWSKVWAEMQKCDVVCANCHRVRTVERHESGEMPLPGRPRAVLLGEPG